jgi:hypothetical protein
MDLLTTCTHYSELQVITALSLISTLHRLQKHPLSLLQLAVFTSCSLATASNSGDSSDSRAQVLCHSRPCRTLVNCQLNYSAISSQPPLQSSTELPSLNWTLSLINQLLHFTSVTWTALIKVRVTLRLAVYRQSVRLGVRPLQTHDQRFFITELLR